MGISEMLGRASGARASEMSHTPILAAVHGRFPNPLIILLAVAAVGYVLWSRLKGQPLEAKRLLVLPVILIVVGVTDITGSSAPHLNGSDLAFLGVGVAIAVALGAARGATMELYPNGGELWQRYRLVTVALWLALIAAKLVLAAIAAATGASAGGGTNTLLLTLGVSLLAEAAIVGPRALSTGVPFAADRKSSGSRRAGQVRTGSSVAERVDDVGPSHPRLPGGGVDSGYREPTPSGDETSQVDNPQWRSPRVTDGVNWLRNQLDQRAATGSSGQARPSRRVADDHHHRHRDGRTRSS
jgi:hypothetical protein